MSNGTYTRPQSVTRYLDQTEEQGFSSLITSTGEKPDIIFTSTGNGISSSLFCKQHRSLFTTNCFMCNIAPRGTDGNEITRWEYPSCLALISCLVGVITFGKNTFSLDRVAWCAGATQDFAWVACILILFGNVPWQLIFFLTSADQHCNYIQQPPYQSGIDQTWGFTFGISLQV